MRTRKMGKVPDVFKMAVMLFTGTAFPSFLREIPLTHFFAGH